LVFVAYPQTVVSVFEWGLRSICDCCFSVWVGP